MRFIANSNCLQMVNMPLYYLLCSWTLGVWITSLSLTIGEGEPLVEREQDHLITFNVSLTFHDESTDIYGNDLWQAEVFTNTRPDGTGDVCVSASEPVDLQGNVTRGTIVPLTGGETSLNISDCLCSEMKYLCLNITKNPDAEPDFTLEVPSEGYIYCVEVDCNGEFS